MLSITPTAVDHLKGLLTQQSPEAGLRVFVSPGGCSGFQYGMSMEERADEGDEVVEDGGSARLCGSVQPDVPKRLGNRL